MYRCLTKARFSIRSCEGRGDAANQRGTLMVVSSEPEKTRLEEAARARTAPLWPVSVARHFRVSTSQTRTCNVSVI